MPANKRMFWKVRATLARAAISIVGHALEREQRPAGDSRVPRARSGQVVDLAAYASHRRVAAHATLGRFVEAGDAIEDGGLAGAVGADEGGDVAAAGLRRQIVDGDEPAEAHGQVLDREQRCALRRAHQPWPS